MYYLTIFFFLSSWPQCLFMKFLNFLFSLSSITLFNNLTKTNQNFWTTQEQTRQDLLFFKIVPFVTLTNFLSVPNIGCIPLVSTIPPSSQYPELKLMNLKPYYCVSSNHAFWHPVLLLISLGKFSSFIPTFNIVVVSSLL